MINVLRLEFFRLKKSKLFWILLGVTALLPVISALATTLRLSVIDAITSSGSEMSGALEQFRSAVTTSIMSSLGMIGYGATLLPLITASVVLSKEFADGTMRNAILANKKRSELYFAYVTVAFTVGAAYMSAFMMTSLIIIAPIYGFGDLTAGQIVSAIFCSLALGLLSIAFAQSCVCMFLFAVRKQWATILFPILITLLVPDIMQTAIILITTILGFQGDTLSYTAMSWIPFYNASLFNAGAIDGALVGKIALYDLLFTAVFTVSGYFTFEKADLK